MVFLKEYFEKVDFEENQQTSDKAKLPSWLRVNYKMSCLATCSPRGGGGYSDILYKRRLGSVFLFKILSFNILGVFSKTNVFWGV